MSGFLPLRRLAGVRHRRGGPSLTGDNPTVGMPRHTGTCLTATDMHRRLIRQVAQAQGNTTLTPQAGHRCETAGKRRHHRNSGTPPLPGQAAGLAICGKGCAHGGGVRVPLVKGTAS